MVAAAVQRLDGSSVPLQERLRFAVRQMHLSTLDSYRRWLEQLGLSELEVDDEGALHQLLLWYLIWGEAANLRHMPECLCLLLYCASNALQLSGASAWEVATLFDEAKGPYGAGGVPGGGAEDFLHSVVAPLYQFLEHEVLHRQKEPVARRVMYDDVNQTLHRLASHRIASPPIASLRLPSPLVHHRYDDVNETFWTVDGVHALLGGLELEVGLVGHHAAKGDRVI